MTYSYIISYGKMRVPLYRVYAQPLYNLAPIPESAFTGRENILLALNVDMEVLGDDFLPAYTQGDNSRVIATDSMKNFILRHALTFTGSTIESFLDTLGRSFMELYPIVKGLRLAASEMPFTAANIPQDDHFIASDAVFKRSHDDYSTVELSLERVEEQIMVTGHRCERLGLQLLKVTGSSFTRFVRDDYTTLPERVDRPLFIYLDVGWKYRQVADMLDVGLARYVPAEQVRDLVQVVFHEFISESIQHLVHEIGQRLLARFPQLVEVSFSAQNRTRDPVGASEADPRLKVYSDPFSAYGVIKLTLSRNE